MLIFHKSCAFIYISEHLKSTMRSLLIFNLFTFDSSVSCCPFNGAITKANRSGFSVHTEILWLNPNETLGIREPVRSWE